MILIWYTGQSSNRQCNGKPNGTPCTKGCRQPDCFQVILFDIIHWYFVFNYSPICKSVQMLQRLLQEGQEARQSRVCGKIEEETDPGPEHQTCFNRNKKLFFIHLQKNASLNTQRKCCWLQGYTWTVNAASGPAEAMFDNSMCVQSVKKWNCTSEHFSNRSRWRVLCWPMVRQWSGNQWDDISKPGTLHKMLLQ